MQKLLDTTINLFHYTYEMWNYYILWFICLEKRRKKHLIKLQNKLSYSISPRAQRQWMWSCLTQAWSVLTSLWQCYHWWKSFMFFHLLNVWPDFKRASAAANVTFLTEIHLGADGEDKDVCRYRFVMSDFETNWWKRHLTACFSESKCQLLPPGAVKKRWVLTKHLSCWMCCLPPVIGHMVLGWVVHMAAMEVMSCCVCNT